MSPDASIISRSMTAPASESTCFVIPAESPKYLLARQVIDRSDAPGNGYPIRVFSAGDDDEFKAFQETIIPVFRQLEWDQYDVRHAEMRFIEATNHSLSSDDHELLLSYYRGEIEHASIISLIKDIDPKEVEKVLVPYRKKACTKFNALEQSDNESWSIRKQAPGSVHQHVAQNDYRSIARTYGQIPDEIINHPIFVRLLSNVIYMAKESRTAATAMQITAWMMSCYTWTKGPTTNSPEGIHQDGADYIVSAYVIERTNVIGGTSRVFREDDLENSLMKFQLRPGEGLFQADAGSPLWHDATHIEIADERQPFGVRSLLGFDVDITG